MTRSHAWEPNIRDAVTNKRRKASDVGVPGELQPNGDIDDDTVNWLVGPGVFTFLPRMLSLQLGVASAAICLECGLVDRKI